MPPQSGVGDDSDRAAAASWTWLSDRNPGSPQRSDLVLRLRGKSSASLFRRRRCGVGRSVRAPAV